VRRVTTPATAPSKPADHGTAGKTWLPAIGSWKYHLLLGSIGILILGPLGGVTASYMNFSLGFFVGGQVLAGILGSSVTYGYGAEGKHGANFMQTAAASVAGMSGMAVLIQAMVWLGLPQPPAWQLVLYLLCIGMFGVGVGMLYTPIACSSRSPRASRSRTSSARSRTSACSASRSPSSAAAPRSASAAASRRTSCPSSARSS
jgi:hypothetical protein